MISIIIPVLNEEKALPETLACLRRQTQDHEIIVVDGGSRDHSRQLVEAYEDIQLLSADPGRASQMNAGASIAKGEWLLFLHADTHLPSNALQAIALLNGDCEAGCFHQRFSRPHWFLSFVSWLHNRRCAHTGVIYGDQAMFIRRDLFQRVGGFPTQAILEDVSLSEMILKLTRPSLLPLTVVTSSRKFDQRGVFRSFFDIVIIMSCYELRLPIMRRGFFASYR